MFQISNDLLPSLAEGLGKGHTLATIGPSQSHTLQSDMGGQPPWAIHLNNFILSTSSTRKQLCCMNYSWPGPLPGGLVMARSATGRSADQSDMLPSSSLSSCLRGQGYILSTEKNNIVLGTLWSICTILVGLKNSLFVYIKVTIVIAL